MQVRDFSCSGFWKPQKRLSFQKRLNTVGQSDTQWGTEVPDYQNFLYYYHNFQCISGSILPSITSKLAHFQTNCFRVRHEGCALYVSRLRSMCWPNTLSSVLGQLMGNRGNATFILLSKWSVLIGKTQKQKSPLLRSSCTIWACRKIQSLCINKHY